MHVISPQNVSHYARTMPRAQDQRDAPLLEAMIIAAISLLVLITLLIHAIWKDKL